MLISTPALPGTTIDPRYPDSDGEPLGETQFHIFAIVHVFEALKQFFRARDDVCVLADSFMYYDEDGRIKSKAPDVLIAFGVRGNHLRRSFRIAEEGVVPSVIFEMTSKKTSHEDQHGKKETYARLGVKEYFLFDPEDLSIEPQMQGFCLHEGRYLALAPDADGRLVSRELGMLLEVEDVLLRLIDTRTGRRLMTFEELFDLGDEAQRRILQAQREAAQAQQQAEQAQQQAEQAQQQAEQARQRAEQAQQQIDQAQQHAEQAQQQTERAQQQIDQAQQEAEAERRRNVTLEAELARLRAAVQKQEGNR